MSHKISVYIIAYNESKNILDAINSIIWADEIVVIDSYSTDNTAQLAEQVGARVIQVNFQGFGHLRNQAISACTHDWIFSLDADERCTPAVEKEIKHLLSSAETADAYFVPRQNFFMNRKIKYTFPYPDYRQPQLFKKGALHYKDEKVHEGYVLSNNTKIGYLKNFITQTPFINLEQLLDKMNRYSSLGAENLLEKKIECGFSTALTHGLWCFFKHYIVKRGFLDGWQGFIIASVSFQYTFSRYAKLIEKKEKAKHEKLL